MSADGKSIALVFSEFNSASTDARAQTIGGIGCGEPWWMSFVLTDNLPSDSERLYYCTLSEVPLVVKAGQCAIRPLRGLLIDDLASSRESALVWFWS